MKVIKVRKVDEFEVVDVRVWTECLLQRSIEDVLNGESFRALDTSERRLMWEDEFVSEALYGQEMTLFTHIIR